jgi:hypothetical protein
MPIYGAMAPLATYQTSRLALITTFAFLVVMAGLAPMFVWQAVASGDLGQIWFVGVWLVVIGALSYQALYRMPRLLELDSAGEIRFVPFRGGVCAICRIDQVTEIVERHYAHPSPYATIRFGTENISVAGFTDLRRFITDVRRTNPDVSVRGVRFGPGEVREWFRKP